MLDLLVIGAGLSGLTAALTAAQAGLSVRVITKGLSALHWGTGCIDLLGYLPDNTPVDTPFAALAHLPALHPLRHIDEASLRQTFLDLQQWLAPENLAYVHKPDDNFWLPSAIGAKRPTYLAPIAQVTARLDDPSPLLIIGFDRLRDFYPTLLADNLTRQGHPARAHTLPLTLLTDRHDANNVHLAEALEDPARVDALAKTLRQVVVPGERIALPALLGIARHAEIVATLENATGARIAEIPTLPPSVPGLRLHQALVRRLTHLGGRVESNMSAIDFGATGDKIEWVATATSARPLRHRAQAYLLATGGFLGGGFNSDHTGKRWETVFNLPLALPDHRGQWFQPEFLDPAGHAIFHGGVQINAAWQPIDATCQLVYENLWAAGNLLVHADAIRTRSHEALALATGSAATHALLAQRPVAISPT